jgi:hypothetical protein
MTVAANFLEQLVAEWYPTDVKVLRSDVEHLLFRTRCLLKYAQELLAE